MTLSLLALACLVREPGNTQPSDTATDTGSGADTAHTVDTAPVDPDEGRCEAMPALPLKSNYLEGYTGAEDFAFDAEGYLVSIDQRGNLVGINQAGDKKVILPQASSFGAGTRFLPGGDLVYCDAATGNLVRVNPADGSSQVLLSGLEYPNGLDVDPEGFAYVAEQYSGNVRRIDTETGEYTIVASDLYNPNGVTFNADYSTLFVGSFGAGYVWAVDRLEGGEWSTPRVYATTPDAPGVPPDPCDVLAPGDFCTNPSTYALGTCADDGTGDLDCESSLDYAACEGLGAGDTCSTDRFGNAIVGACTEASDGSGLFCPRSTAASVEACVDSAEGAACSTDTLSGQCIRSWEGVQVCADFSNYEAMYTQGCVDRAEGDACFVDNDAYPSVGVCQDGADWGISGLACLPDGVNGAGAGGLDGINTDECGNLYVTEYVLGKVWRFSAEGTAAELVSKLSSSWIPNMHWGNGVGGWELDVLYVMDREQRGVFTLETGVRGHGDAFTP